MVRDGDATISTGRELFSDDSVFHLQTFVENIGSSKSGAWVGFPDMVGAQQGGRAPTEKKGGRPAVSGRLEVAEGWRGSGGRVGRKGPKISFFQSSYLLLEDHALSFLKILFFPFCSLPFCSLLFCSLTFFLPHLFFSLPFFLPPPSFFLPFFFPPFFPFFHVLSFFVLFFVPFLSLFHFVSSVFYLFFSFFPFFSLFFPFSSLLFFLLSSSFPPFLFTLFPSFFQVLCSRYLLQSHTSSAAIKS